jgi:hypothetical protein
MGRSSTLRNFRHSVHLACPARVRGLHDKLFSLSKDALLREQVRHIAPKTPWTQYAPHGSCWRNTSVAAAHEASCHRGAQPSTAAPGTLASAPICLAPLHDHYTIDPHYERRACRRAAPRRSILSFVLRSRPALQSVAVPRVQAILSAQQRIGRTHSPWQPGPPYPHLPPHAHNAPTRRCDSLASPLPPPSAPLRSATHA